MKMSSDHPQHIEGAFPDREYRTYSDKVPSFDCRRCGTLAMTAYAMICLSCNDFLRDVTTGQVAALCGRCSRQVTDQLNEVGVDHLVLRLSQVATHQQSEKGGADVPSSR